MDSAFKKPGGHLGRPGQVWWPSRPPRNHRRLELVLEQQRTASFEKRHIAFVLGSGDMLVEWLGTDTARFTYMISQDFFDDRYRRIVRVDDGSRFREVRIVTR